MTLFTPVSSPNRPIRFLVVGAGQMGRAWLQVLNESPDVEVAGIVDLDLELARGAAESAGGETSVDTSVSRLAKRTGAVAAVNVTIPEAHHLVNSEALESGLHVLCEKPLAPTVSMALRTAAVARSSSRLLMVSQSRRYLHALSAFRGQLAEMGEVGFLVAEMYRGPHFGGFRERMPHVLLVDMAIHTFDAARFLLDGDAVSVYCEEFNPKWSWYAGASAATAVFEMSGGRRFTYSGSWCSAGFETSWNGRWRASGARGTALWDGEGAPQLDLDDGGVLVPDLARTGPEGIAGALAEFVTALRSGISPSGEASRNIGSLAMVEAAVRSAQQGKRVRIADVLSSALTRAMADEPDGEQHDLLASVLLN
ncbi:Gfo/Idh/MocA family protein [Pseudolysinimonas yzui]|uniref:Dehydrogenase n=1 Tax=Pseudolysinimonas yzui TaxID=2708254 RepID=A0A8J3GSP1_9MICO|nr:Gfo/Idh/MocA family oxidoreductase [Pseudolysinimonas yzui]GHF26509.1 dehydrogenase [Pseudolysinimonas yzui]